MKKIWLEDYCNSKILNKNKHIVAGETKNVKILSYIIKNKKQIKWMNNNKKET